MRNNSVRKIIRVVVFVILMPFAILMLHGLIAWCVMHIPAETSGENNNGTTTIFVHCDAVHSEIILPVTSHDISFRNVISLGLNDSLAAVAKYVSISWGDLHFFEHTPRWEDLTVVNAIRAAVGIDSTALHVNVLMYEPDASQNISCKITADNLRRLASFIEGSIAREEEGLELVQGLHYGERDFFVVSKGVYSMFYNCNSWANDALKYAGCPASVYTIFPAGIVKQYPTRNY